MKTAATAAKAIKNELKKQFPGIKFSVRSDNFAGGNSVDIEWMDGPTVEEVEQITDKYQYGHFDGMVDMYEYSNMRKDIPQAKYVMTDRRMSNFIRSQIAEYLRQNFAGCENATDNDWIENFQCYFNTLIYREFYKISYCNKSAEVEYIDFEKELLTN